MMPEPVKKLFPIATIVSAEPKMPTMLNIPVKGSSAVPLMFIGTLILIVALLFGFCTAVFGQPRLDKTYGLHNTDINCIAVKPQTKGLTVFAGCRSNGSFATLWRSSDGGTMWQSVRHFLDNLYPIDGIVFDQHDRQTILVSSSPAISHPGITWKSNDGGETWVRRIENGGNRLPMHTATTTTTTTHDSTYILWEPIQHISNSPLLEAVPRLQVSGNDIFMMWLTPNASYSFFAQSSDCGLSWTAPTILPDTTDQAGNRFYSSNKFVVAKPYIYFTTQYRTGPESYNLWFRKWLIGDSTKGQGRVLFDSTGPDLMSAVGSEVVLSYHFEPQFSAPYFAYSPDRGSNWTRFSPGISLGQSAKAMSLIGTHLQIARVSVVSGSSEVKFSVSTNNGSTWGPEVFLSSLDTVISDEPHLAADSTGNVFVVWRDGKYGSTTGFGGSIILRRSTDYGQTWLPEQVLTTIPSGVFPRASLAGVRVAVVWGNEVNSDTGVVYYGSCRTSLDHGQNWSSEFVFAPKGGEPDVVVNENTIHVSWFGNGSPSSNLEIFYRRGTFITVGVKWDEKSIPDEPQLLQNYPNPFNGVTQLRYSLPRRVRVTLEVFDVLGRQVATLADGVYDAGVHSISWNSGGASSGIYFGRLQAKGKIVHKKLLLIR